MHTLKAAITQAEMGLGNRLEESPEIRFES